MKYPKRYTAGYIGQKVFRIVSLPLLGNAVAIVEEEITDISDDAEIVGVPDSDCAIGYWVKNCGHALYFGEDLFLTREEAEEASLHDY